MVFLECWSMQLYEKETLAQVFSCEFCEICQNILFAEHFWKTTFIDQTTDFNHSVNHPSERTFGCYEFITAKNFSSRKSWTGWWDAFIQTIGCTATHKGWTHVFWTKVTSHLLRISCELWTWWNLTKNSIKNMLPMMHSNHPLHIVHTCVVTRDRHLKVEQ